MQNELYDSKEREPANQPLEPPPARRRTPPSRLQRRTRRRKFNIPPPAAAAIGVILVAALLLPAFLKGKKPEPELPPDLPAEDKPVTFRFGDMVLTPIKGIPLNSYDRDSFVTDEKGRIAYEADGHRTKAGIDVSTHQKDIDWQAVAADGIDFAMLRMGYRGYTEGGLFVDPTFEQNLRGALDAGVEVGVYFFSQAITPEEAAEEADYVLHTLNGQELTFPIAFDWEFISNSEARTNDQDGSAMTDCAVAFCERIKDAGYQPAVYFNRTLGYLHYDLRALKDYNLWLAEYDAAPDFYYHFDLLQYSETGQVNGIQGNVDLNIAFFPDDLASDGA